MKADIYSIGIVHCSVCVPEDATPEDVTYFVNATPPHSWEISKEPFFAGGAPNPCPCNSGPGRLHYLMVC
jgi:hypothetical protein